MQVFKFGGASVQSAEGVKQVANILETQGSDDMWVVVSAMGKTTNRMERLLEAYREKNEALLESILQENQQFHQTIVAELQLSQEAQSKIHDWFVALAERCQVKPNDNRSFDYDAIVSFGELISTTIVACYLREKGIIAQWLDARKLICTNSNYQEGKVNLELTAEKVLEAEKQFKGARITQGFIGSESSGNTTTLGREGSDYSAAILAWCSNASGVTIWKDVPGLLNADPKKKENTVLLSKISYKEAVELSYYGASVIHPKTIQPLQNKQIPLYVRSFVNPELPGSVIQAEELQDTWVPSYILKENQMLISVMPRDFSFVVEEHLSDLFETFHRHGVKVNLMQNSALNFSVVVESNYKSEEAVTELKSRYRLLYNTQLELITIRHYHNKTIDDLIKGREVLLEQRTRQTLRYVVK